MKLVLVCICLLSSTFGFAQTAHQFAITGTISDRHKIPIPFANAALYNQRDSSLVTGAVSDLEGHFSITASAGKYFIKVTFLSYEEKSIPGFVVNSLPVSLGSIVLEDNAELLSEVVVEGERSQMELQLDKRVFNIEKDMSNIGRNAAEVLDNIPSVSVDVEGNVSLRGSENVRILINGKPSGLTGISSTDALRQLQGSMIENIEVVTNPSARFDAEGEVGIINIILKKESRHGVNGAFTATGGYPANYGSSFNMNYRHNKLNLNGSYGLNYRSGPGYGNSYQQYSSADTSFVYKQSQSRTRQDLSHNFMAGIDYSFDDKSSINATIAYQKSNGMNTSTREYQDFDSDGALTQTVIRTEEEEEPEENIDASLGYRKEFKRQGQLLTVDAKLIRSSELEMADYWQGDELGNTNLQQRAENTENESTQLVQADYIHPFGKAGKIESGIKSTVRIIDNDYMLEQLNNVSGWEVMPAFNNNLIYTEKIQALYAMAANTIKQFSYQLGVRGEYSDITTELTETEEVNRRTYFNIFPSTHFSYKLSQFKSLQLSYSYRISRPRFRDLMPFSNFSDSRVFFTGNPNLNPEYTHSIEGGYLLNWPSGSLLSSGYYRHRLGVVQRVTQVEDDGLTTIFPVNLATENAYGLEFNLSFTLKKWWRLNSNANFYRAITQGEHEGLNLFSDTYTWNGRITSRMTFLKKLDFQTSMNYRAPRITPQGKDLAMYGIDLGLSRDLLKGSATVTASVSDLLNSRKRRNIVDSEGYYSNSVFQGRPRQFLLNFSYRLNQKKENRNRDRDNGDDFDDD